MLNILLSTFLEDKVYFEITKKNEVTLLEKNAHSDKGTKTNQALERTRSFLLSRPYLTPTDPQPVSARSSTIPTKKQTFGVMMFSQTLRRQQLGELSSIPAILPD